MNVIEKSSSTGAANDASSSGLVDPASVAPAELAALALQFKQALGGAVSTDAEGSPKLASPVFGLKTLDAEAEQLPHASTGLDVPALPADLLSLDRAFGAKMSVPNPKEGAGSGAGDSVTDSSTIATANIPASVEAIAREGKRETDPTTDPSPDTIGAAVLQSLLNQSSGATVPVANTRAATPSSASTPVQSLESVVADTVSRVLVSDPLHDGRREVRIEIAKDVLPDTEVRLWRQEGRLHVEFTSSPAVAEGGLKDALPRLGDAIQQRQPEPETPVVTLRTNSMDAGGQPGDGRSRQQYYVPQNEEELT